MTTEPTTTSKAVKAIEIATSALLFVAILVAVAMLWKQNKRNERAEKRAEKMDEAMLKKINQSSSNDN